MRTWKVVVGLALFIVATVVALFIVSIVRFGNRLSDIGERERLAPISVPTTTCPAIALVRATTAAAGDGWFEQLNATEQWPVFAAQLGPELSNLAAALRYAIPRSPPPIAARFTTILNKVTIGQRELPTSTSLVQYIAATDGAVFAGETALNEASDLVGDACGAALYEER